MINIRQPDKLSGCLDVEKDKSKFRNVENTIV